MKRLACVYLLLAVAPQLLLAQSTGALMGRVRDAGSGAGIPGAVVRLTPSSLTATTDEAGTFVMLGVPAGGYTAEVSTSGFASATVVGLFVD